MCEVAQQEGSWSQFWKHLCLSSEMVVTYCNDLYDDDLFFFSL